ncbi:hypothetical protein QBC46DRAFT_346709 [Diplogelasinospora grovesii]|uniref:Uncharacterized protein n=1 Tax=Diplogelasinospora grovesii TaxID=303347 RepID=A0AAN6MXK2_9PEZI|nr:hypothetical protein QBC46DRAFT_346709 [Diplogelasinospora grovesii]
MNNNSSERAPLLGARRDAADEQASSGLPPAVLHRSFVSATMASLIAGSLTMVFLLVSMIVMSNRPSDYYPPYEVYYHFAPTAGWSIIAMLHSGFTLIRIRAGDTPSRSVAGILVDVVAGLYFLFQSLYGMQQLIEGDNYPYFGCRPRDVPHPDCDAWRARAEAVFWCYLFVLFVFGLAHAVLLFLRASLWKRTN